MQNSKNTARILLIILVAILSSITGSIIFLALWPYLSIVGELLVGLAVVLVSCAIVLAIAWTHHKLALMELARDNYLLTSGEVVAVVRKGQIEHLSKLHEEAKRPLMLPPPVSVKEIHDEELDERSKILNLRAKGLKLRQIEKVLGIPYNRVQSVCAEATDLVIE